MSTLKTLTSVATAAVLVTGIGMAFAQSEETPPVQPAPAMPLASDQASPADPSAMPQSDAASQQQTPANPATPSDPLAKPAAQHDMPTPPAVAPRHEPAPKADRN